MTPARPLRTWVAALALVLACLTWAVAADWAPVTRPDATVARWSFALTVAHPATYDWWLGASTYGGPMVLRLALLVLAVACLVLRRWALATWLVVTALVENVVAPLSKDLLNRPRPRWPHPLVVERSTSFPSGHSAAAGMFATAIVLLALTMVTSRLLGRVLLVTGVVVGLLVAASRVFLGVHYLSDVVGGLLLGVLLTLSTWLVVGAVSARTAAATPRA
jgi:undecaprenyl-diphosphatase